MTFTRAVATNNWGPAKFVVDGTTVANGTHSTIAAALTSASSGDTIFIRPGTFTENLTLKAGVNLTAFGSDSSANATGKVIISGTCTLTTAGSVTISGIQLQTNSAALLAVTGSEASIVNLQNCYLNCTNNTGITFSSSSSSAQINIEYCRGNLGTTGIGYFSDSSAGTLNIDYCDFTNTGASVTASTKSAGLLSARFSSLRFVLTYSSSITTSSYVMCDASTNSINTTAITTSGTGTFTIDGGRVDSGTASAISVGAGTTVACRNCIVFSSNTNAITGAGTLNYQSISFSSSSSTINVTTQTSSGTLHGSKNTAPAAGFLGEQIRATAASGSVNITPSSTATNLASISLTAGVWDVSALAIIGTTGNSTFATISISTVSATEGTSGDNKLTFGGPTFASLNYALSIPSYRITLTSTTTIYAVVNCTFTTGAATAGGRISATRVG